MRSAVVTLSLALPACTAVSGLDDFRANGMANNGGDADGGSAGQGGFGGGSGGIGGTTGSGACAIVDGPLGQCSGPGLQACFQFDNNLDDAGPNGLHATNAEPTMATFVSDGADGAAVHLEGAALEVPQSSALTTTTLSLGAWIRPQSTPPQGNRRGIVDHQNGYSLFIHSDGHLSGTATGMPAPVESAPEMLPVGEWHHVAITANGTSGHLYIDGVEVASQTQDMPSPTDDIVYIGANNEGGEPAELFRGDIDMVVIRDVVLIGSEICGD